MLHITRNIAFSTPIISNKQRGKRLGINTVVVIHLHYCCWNLIKLLIRNTYPNKVLIYIALSQHLSRNPIAIRLHNRVPHSFSC